MKAITKARIAGWSLPALAYVNQLLSQNGGVIPTNNSQWLTLISSAVVALGIHIGSGTSAGHPDGAKTNSGQATNPKVGQAGFARISVAGMIAVLMVPVLLFAPIACHHVNSSNPAVIQAVSLLDARKTVNSIAHGLKAANDTVKSLAVTEPDYYTYVHPKLAQLAVLNDRANAAITAAENGSTTVDWKSAIVAVAQGAGDPASLTTFGFKNPSTVAKVQVGFAGLIEGISLAQQFGSQ